jgi:hypothetical protein
MTVNQLHKLLTKLIAKGHGRRGVYVDKGSYRHALESDGCIILPVSHGEMHTYLLLNDDGGAHINADGTERQRTSLVLIGDSYSSWHEKGVRPPPQSDRKENARAKG